VVCADLDSAAIAQVMNEAIQRDDHEEEGEEIEMRTGRGDSSRRHARKTPEV
jgi:hypothetical protein